MAKNRTEELIILQNGDIGKYIFFGLKSNHKIFFKGFL
jgi:hypothetical protein